MFDTIKAALDSALINKHTDRFALHDVAPGAVLEPRNVDEAAAIMRLAHENKWRVECAGSGSQASGNRRTRADVVVSTRRMDRVLEYDAADLVIGVQAGKTLHSVQRETRKNAQFFAQDPISHDQSTVGGVIASGRSGPLRFAFGTPRDQVLGLQIVTGDGRILNLGGRVVKNVAGYDLVRLVVGSAGTLGLIASAYLRLRPVPQADQTIVLMADTPPALMEAAEFVVEEHLEAVAMELASPGVIRPSWSLLIRLSGNPQSVADARARLVAKSMALRCELHQSGIEDWRTLEKRQLDAQTEIRLADLPSRTAATLQAARKLADKAGRDAYIVAHAGDGIVRVYIGTSDIEETAFAIGEARTLMGVSGGTVIVHSRNGDLMRRVDAYGAAGTTLQLMSKLKNVFDPGSILAPGRFVI